MHRQYRYRQQRYKGFGSIIRTTRSILPGDNRGALSQATIKTIDAREKQLELDKSIAHCYIPSDIELINSI